MPRWTLVLAAVVVVLLIASQLLLLPLGERRAEDRLTAGGGSADVDLSAVPALRLLFADGDRVGVEARDLDLDLDRRTEVLGRLDGFGEVDVSIADSTVGAFDVRSFELQRDGSGPYRLVATSEVTPSALLGYGLESLDVPGGPLAGFALGQLLGDADSPVPIDLDLEFVSDDGRLRVTSGGGTVAGLPTGPLAELLTAAVVVEL